MGLQLRRLSRFQVGMCALKVAVWVTPKGGATLRNWLGSSFGDKMKTDLGPFLHQLTLVCPGLNAPPFVCESPCLSMACALPGLSQSSPPARKF